MISRERIVELLMVWFLSCGDKSAHPKERIDALATYLINGGVTVQKHGRWVDGICTNCGVEALEYVDEEGDWLVYTTDYCPNCGAKMDADA